MNDPLLYKASVSIITDLMLFEFEFEDLLLLIHFKSTLPIAQFPSPLMTGSLVNRYPFDMLTNSLTNA